MKKIYIKMLMLSKSKLKSIYFVKIIKLLILCRYGVPFPGQYPAESCPVYSDVKDPRQLVEVVSLLPLYHAAQKDVTPFRRR